MRFWRFRGDSACTYPLAGSALHHATERYVRRRERGSAIVAKARAEHRPARHPNVGLRQQVADGVIPKVFTRPMFWLTVAPGHAVEGFVGESLGEVLVGVGAGEHVAEHVIRIGEVLLMLPALARIAVKRPVRHRRSGW